MAHHGMYPCPRCFQFLTRFSIFQADSLDRKFEKPLRNHLDGYKTVVAVSIPVNLTATHFDTQKIPQERSASYERALKEKSHIIRQTELSNLNKRTRSTCPSAMTSSPATLTPCPQTFSLSGRLCRCCNVRSTTWMSSRSITTRRSWNMKKRYGTLCRERCVSSGN